MLPNHVDGWAGEVLGDDGVGHVGASARHDQDACGQARLEGAGAGAHPVGVVGHGILVRLALVLDVKAQDGVGHGGPARGGCPMGMRGLR
jgi:hypothetical protein